MAARGLAPGPNPNVPESHYWDGKGLISAVL
jgi:hypothetical protein